MKLFEKFSFKILTVLLISVTLVSLWLLQENGPWDLMVFIFISLPVNLILLIIFCIVILNHIKQK